MPKEDPLTEARPIEHLVGSVLGSVVKAQGLAASQLVEMIDKVGFETPANPGDPRKTRMFDFDFVRNEVNASNNRVERHKVSASVPLLTLINLPAIAIEEAKVRMELRLVAHEQDNERETTSKGPKPLNLFVVPARKQVVRGRDHVQAVDPAGTIKIDVTMRQHEPLGLSKLQNLLDTAGEENQTLDTEPVPIGPTS